MGVLTDHVLHRTILIDAVTSFYRNDYAHNFSNNLRAYKSFNEPRPFVDEFADLLVGRLNVFAENAAPFSICYVPAKLGFEQKPYHLIDLADAISSKVPLLSSGPMRAALSFVRQVDPVKGIDCNQRDAAIAGSMKANTIVAGKVIVVIDDIRASGATLRECARALFAAGAAEVASIVVAQRVDL
ncbi:phosphoribosyltransferase family protein [Afipia clevelandensis]|uniref:phosphoribosyltransferase family protein n=1 Tax=Afipia clevelandensis TaxID=1034 RepID=UPI0009DAFA60|nr:phosphoribosyltransferase family protein [Afipia clevelandensis]